MKEPKYKYTDKERPLLKQEKESIRNLIFGMEPREKEYALELLLYDKENPVICKTSEYYKKTNIFNISE